MEAKEGAIRGFKGSGLAFGCRVDKTINSNNTGFLYDGDNPIQELDGSSPSANLLTGLGIDEYFQRSDSSGSRSFLTDALGSSRALADDNGTVLTQYSYQPFGQTTESGNTSSNSFQYTGRENDGTGLYFYRARYYHPELRRFISEDPIGLRGGINPYAYVNASPTNYIDPYGLLTLAEANAIGAGIGAVGGFINGAFAGAKTGGVAGAIGGGVIGAASGGSIGIITTAFGSIHGMGGSAIPGAVFGGGYGAAGTIVGDVIGASIPLPAGPMAAGAIGAYVGAGSVGPWSKLGAILGGTIGGAITSAICLADEECSSELQDVCEE